MTPLPTGHTNGPTDSGQGGVYSIEIKVDSFLVFLYAKDKASSIDYFAFRVRKESKLFVS